MTRHAALALAAACLIAACGKPPEEKKSGPPPALITVAEVTQGQFEVVEETLGTLEALSDPKLGAEIAGRIEKVLARSGQAVKAGQLLATIDPGDIALQQRADLAEVRRLEALAAQQERLLERQQTLVAKGFLSKNAGDDVAAQRAAIAARLAKGMAVRLTSPLEPGKVYASRIHDIRPNIVEGSRSLDVLADIENDGLLRSGGTVNATISISARTSVLTVPEQSVVLRPAGKVVYVIAEAEGKKLARQQVVKTGAKRGGRIEILDGLAGGETVALDGAGFLTHNAAVSIKEASGSAKPPAKVGAGGTAPSGTP